MGKTLHAIVGRVRTFWLLVRRGPGSQVADLRNEVQRLAHDLLRGERAVRDAERRAREASSDVARLHAELDAREHELERAEHRARRTWLQHHPYDGLDEPTFRGPDRAVAKREEDYELVERIVAAYGRSADRNYYGEGSMWTFIHERVADVHQALIEQNVPRVAEMLRDPTRNQLLYGFEAFFRDAATLSEPGRRGYTADVKDRLVRLAEALALVPLECPEGAWGETWGMNIDLPTTELVALVERRLGIRVPIEPVQRGFSGLAVDGRVVTGRMVDAVYLAQRAAELLAHVRAPRVLEIGAGLGYAAYYAHQLGLSDYTIVDLPLTSVAQTYFLGRTLGPDRIVLEGEAEDLGAPSPRIKIATPALLRERRDCFDVVLNVDSLTEVGLPLATEYAKQILAIAPAFLSINHEVNVFSVHQLFDEDRATIERFPYWLRNGYAEELIRRG